MDESHFPTKPETTVAATLTRLGFAAPHTAEIAAEVIRDLRSHGWKISGEYRDTTN